MMYSISTLLRLKFCEQTSRSSVGDGGATVNLELVRNVWGGAVDWQVMA